MNRYFYFACLVLLFIGCKEDTIEKNKIEAEETTIKIKGSNTEKDLVQKMAQIFNAQLENPLSFEISGGGSNEGVEALKNEQANIVNSSRKLSEEEYAYFHGQDRNIGSIIFALDAIAIITHPSVGVDSLSIFQLSQIYAGEVTNWKALGGRDQKISVYGRNDASGTHAYMKDRLLGSHVPFYNRIHELDNNKKILKAVESDSNAIGYVDLGTVTLEHGLPYPNVWVANLYIDQGGSFSPFEFKAIQNEDYPLTRPLFQYFDKPLSEEAKQYLKFELGEQGQQIVKAHGFYPILSIHRHINSEEGF